MGHAPAMVMRAKRASALTAVLAAVLLSAGCAQIAMREAMGRVQRRYVDLVAATERGWFFEARDRAKALRQAFFDPAISSRSPHASEDEFQRLLEDVLGAVEGVRKRAETFDSTQLLAAGGEVSSRCQACHDRFRSER